MHIMKPAREQRHELRLQFGNRHHLDFSLTNNRGDSCTDYCLCTDLSVSGAKFFTSRDIPVGASLLLTLSLEGREIESLPVTVVRCNSELNDEERYCCSVKFNRELASFELLADEASIEFDAA